jgi:hypothetical protein
MRSKPFLQNLIVTFWVLIFFAAFILRYYWSKGGHDWSYWLGSLLMSEFVTITGLGLAIGAMTFSEEFIHDKLFSKGRVGLITKSKRIHWAIVGILLTIIGIGISIAVSRQILIGLPIQR